MYAKCNIIVSPVCEYYFISSYFFCVCALKQIVWFKKVGEMNAYLTYLH